MLLSGFIAAVVLDKAHNLVRKAWSLIQNYLKGENGMANLQERRDKSGRLISYSIRVYRGRGMDGRQLKPWTATFEVLPGWSEKTARKKAETFAATFEKECKEGLTSDSRLKFAE